MDFQVEFIAEKASIPDHLDAASFNPKFVCENLVEEQKEVECWGKSIENLAYGARFEGGYAWCYRVEGFLRATPSLVYDASLVLVGGDASFLVLAQV